MNFFQFIKIMFLFFGFDLDGNFASSPNISTILRLWMFLNPILMIIGMIQLWIYLILMPIDSMASEITIIIFSILFALNSFAGYLTIIATRKSSINLMMDIEKNYSKTTNSSLIEDEDIVKSSFSMGLKFFAMIIGSVVLNLVTCLGKIAIGIFTNSDPGNLSMMLMWYPAVLENSHLFVAIYDPLLMLLFCVSNLFVPEMIFITSAYLTASFDKLGDKVKDVIDGTENRSFLETKRKLAECVDLHSELIKLTDESNKLYGPYNLVFLVLISMRICMLGIMIMISDIETALQLLAAALANFVMIYLFCKIGDLLEEEVSSRG